MASRRSGIARIKLTSHPLSPPPSLLPLPSRFIVFFHDFYPPPFTLLSTSPISKIYIYIYMHKVSREELVLKNLSRWINRFSSTRFGRNGEEVFWLLSYTRFMKIRNNSRLDGGGFWIFEFLELFSIFSTTWGWKFRIVKDWLEKLFRQGSGVWKFTRSLFLSCSCKKKCEFHFDRFIRMILTPLPSTRIYFFVSRA